MSRRLIALYFAITVLLALPLSIDPAHRVISAAPDTDLFMWTLSWDAHALVTHPWRIFDANIYYPQPLTLAYSENLIGSAVFAAPILWATGNPVLAMNVVVLLSSVLCGFGAYALGRSLGMRCEAAALSGLIFAFTPPRFLRLDQVHLATVQWIPFALASFHRYLAGGRRRDLRLTAAFFALQALSSGHAAVFAALSLAIVFAWHAASGGAVAPLRRVRDLGWPGLVIAAPIVAAVVPYLWIQREMGLRRSLEDWSVPASSFLASPTYVQTAFLSLIPNSGINETAGAYLFPGFLPVALAILAFARPRERESSGSLEANDRRTVLLRDPKWCYAALTLLSMWLTIGPPFGLWPLVYWLPGLNFIRAPSRFIILAVLGLAVLGGLGFDCLAARVSNAGRRAVLLGVLLIAEFAAVPLGTEPYTLEIPEVDRWLATQPAPFVVAEVPLPDSRDLNLRERRQTMFMLHSMAHWQKTIHGYSGLRPPLHEELYRELLRFPDEQTLSDLESLGVTFVVVHTDLYEEGEWPAVEARLRTFGEHLRLEHQDASGRVYRLVLR